MHACRHSVLPLARPPNSNHVEEGGFPADCEGNLVLALSLWLSSRQGSDTPSSIRIRENQRRSRNQRKELIQDLRRRVQEYEIKGVAATQEMQRAARKVAEENSLLRSLLASRGVTHHEVEAYLRSFNTTTTTPITTAPITTAPSHAPHMLPVPTGLPRTPVSHQVVVPKTVPLCMPPPTQSPAQTSIGPLAPTTSQPQAQPRSEPQSIQRPAPAAMDASPASTCCKPADGTGHDNSTSTFPMLQEDAECPNTASCFCAPTPMPKETPLDTGLLISCETAATIISEMRGDADRSRIRASLGCVGDEECTVKNTRVLELMDER